MWWELLWLIVNHWYVAAWAGATIIAYIVGGRKWALIVATLGIGASLYQKGRQDEKDYLEAHYRETQERREKAYDEIDNRGTDRDDVDQRLRDNSF